MCVSCHSWTMINGLIGFYEKLAFKRQKFKLKGQRITKRSSKNGKVRYDTEQALLAGKFGASILELSSNSSKKNFTHLVLIN